MTSSNSIAGFVLVNPFVTSTTGISSAQSAWCPHQKFRAVQATHKRTRNITTPRKAQPITCEWSVSQAIQRALRNQFKGKDISRVVKSFQDVINGKSLENDKGAPNHQRAESFVEGLDAVPFTDEFTPDYEWVNHLEKNWSVIAEELKQVTSQSDIEQKGNNIWAPPVVEAANAYGPDWRTLVLQDRKWDPVNTKLFPKTTAILQDSDANIPSVEAFFARQDPNTGIKLHTDDCNFILTMHLGLSVPHEKSWIEVGGERRYWENGKGLVFNTSYFHQTMNESSDEERLVLLIRFWHPQLTRVERDALSFIFQAIEAPDSNSAVLKASEEIEAEKEKAAKRKKGSLDAKMRASRSNIGGKGFGK